MQIVVIVVRVNHFNSLHLWLLLFFKYNNSSSRQKGSAATVQQSRIKLFPFVTATNGASPCGVVSVRTCARRVNSVAHTVVLKHKPVRGALWQVLAHACTVSAGAVLNRYNNAV